MTEYIFQNPIIYPSNDEHSYDEHCTQKNIINYLIELYWEPDNGSKSIYFYLINNKEVLFTLYEFREKLYKTYEHILKNINFPSKVFDSDIEYINPLVEILGDQHKLFIYIEYEKCWKIMKIHNDISNSKDDFFKNIDYTHDFYAIHAIYTIVYYLYRSN